MSTSRFATARGRLFFSVCNVLVAALTVMAVFRGLPLRHWLVDGSTILCAAGFGIGTVGLWMPSQPKIARIGLGIVSTLGLLSLIALVTGLGALEGIHGPLAAGSRLILVLVGAMIVPYLVVLPGIELSWLRDHAERNAPPPQKKSTPSEKAPEKSNESSVESELAKGGAS